MNCEDVRKYIYPLLDNELDTDKNIEVLSHLNMCESCQERMEAEKSFHRKLSDALTDRSAPEDTREFLREKLTEARAERSWFRRLQTGVNRALPAAAALLLVLAAGLVIYTGIALRDGPTAGEMLNTMPAYHDDLMRSNKHHYEKQVRSQSFVTRDRLEKKLMNASTLAGDRIKIPSLDEKQCKILDGGLRTDGSNPFGAPFFHVVYCYQPEKDARLGITYLAIQRALPVTAGNLGGNVDRRIRKKGKLYYINEDEDLENTVFWGNSEKTFALISDQVNLKKLLELAKYARRQSLQRNRKATDPGSAQGRDF